MYFVVYVVVLVVANSWISFVVREQYLWMLYSIVTVLHLDVNLLMHAWRYSLYLQAHHLHVFVQWHYLSLIIQPLLLLLLCLIHSEFDILHRKWLKIDVQFVLLVVVQSKWNIQVEIFLYRGWLFLLILQFMIVQSQHHRWLLVSDNPLFNWILLQ